MFTTFLKVAQGFPMLTMSPGFLLHVRKYYSHMNLETHNKGLSGYGQTTCPNFTNAFEGILLHLQNMHIAPPQKKKDYLGKNN